MKFSTSPYFPQSQSISKQSTLIAFHIAFLIPFYYDKNPPSTKKTKRKFTTHYLLIYFYGWKSTKCENITGEYWPDEKKRDFLSPNFKIGRSKISMKRAALKNAAMPMFTKTVAIPFISLSSVEYRGRLLLHLIRWSFCFFFRVLNITFFRKFSYSMSRERCWRRRMGKKFLLFFSAAGYDSIPPVCLICIHLYNRFLPVQCLKRDQIYILKLIQNKIEN